MRMLWHVRAVLPPPEDLTLPVLRSVLVVSISAGCGHPAPVHPGERCLLLCQEPSFEQGFKRYYELRSVCEAYPSMRQAQPIACMPLRDRLRTTPLRRRTPYPTPPWTPTRTAPWSSRREEATWGGALGPMARSVRGPRTCFGAAEPMVAASGLPTLMEP